MQEVLTLKRSLRKVWVLIAGTVIIITGIIISPLPGPGFTILGPVGLALIASEFVWARRLLKQLQERASLLTDQTNSLGRQTHPIFALPVIIGYWVLVWFMARELGGIPSKVIWALSFPLFTPIALWAWATWKFRNAGTQPESPGTSVPASPNHDTHMGQVGPASRAEQAAKTDQLP